MSSVFSDLGSLGVLAVILQTIPVQPRLANVDCLIARRKPTEYAEAVKLLVDLRAAAGRAGQEDFDQRLAAFRAAHSRKPALMHRMDKAGL